jgi:REP element-mobilizing transposase RayT
MRRCRVKVEGKGVYHCISRIAGGAHLLGEVEKEVFRKMVQKVSVFCGVEVLTYCVMSNHFHLLVRVGVDPCETLDRAELLRRYRAFYGEQPTTIGYPSYSVLKEHFDRESPEADHWERCLRARMNDVSAFMKTLKQRFSLWFNVRHQRFGTLWADRFTSVLVENAPFALKTVAAYIDLNPVRAGLVKDPADYRWCGYTQAMAGDSGAIRGLATVTDTEREQPDRQITLSAYREVIFGKGATVRRERDGMIDWERAQKVLASGGRVGRIEYLRCRTRYFTDGVVLGSRAFVAQFRREKVTGRALRLRFGETVNARRNFLPGEKSDSVPSPPECRAQALPLEADEGELWAWQRPRRTRRQTAINSSEDFRDAVNAVSE